MGECCSILPYQTVQAACQRKSHVSGWVCRRSGRDTSLCPALPWAVPESGHVESGSEAEGRPFYALLATIETRPMLSEIYGRFTKARHPGRTGLQAVGRSWLKNVAEPDIRCLLDRVKQRVEFDGHIEVWADGFPS
jgi:hypothetical protein